MFSASDLTQFSNKTATSPLITQNSNTMPYGQGGRMGDSVNPALFNPDFSGYANAGMISGQALSGLGSDIGGVIKERKAQQKRDGQNEKFLQQALDMFQGTELESPVGKAYKQYISEETTDKQRRAIGESIRETIGLGMAAQDMKMKQAALMAKGGVNKRWTGGREELAQFIDNGWQVGDYVENPDGSISANLKTPSPGLFGNAASVSYDADGNPTISPGQQQRIGATMPQMGGGAAASGISAMLPNQQGAAPAGVAVDGSPGVLPPRQDQLAIPSGIAPQAAPQPQMDAATSSAISKAAEKEVPVTTPDGGFSGEVTQMKGSEKEVNVELKKAQLDKLRQDLGIDKDLTDQEKSKLLKSSNDFSRDIRKLAHQYSKLDDAGDIPAAGRPAIISAAKNLPFVKGVATAAGAEGMTERAAIDGIKLNVMKSLRNLTGMGTKEMDTPAEVKRQLDAMGSAEMPVEAALIMLKGLIDKYGDGQSFDDLLNNSLKARYKSFDMPEKKFETESGLSEGTQSFLDKYPALK
jgi:ribosomal protein L7/L12